MPTPATASKKKQVTMSDVSTACRLAARIVSQFPANVAKATPAAAPDMSDTAKRAAAAIEKVRQLAPFISRVNSATPKVGTTVIQRLATHLRATKLALSELEAQVSKSNQEFVRAQQVPTAPTPAAMTQSTIVLPTLKNLVCELMALHQGMGPFEIDWENKTISVPVAKDVTLDGNIKLGDFKAVFFWGDWARNLATGQASQGESLFLACPIGTPNYAYNEDYSRKNKYYHPHVNPGSDNRINPNYGVLCYGSTYSGNVRACLNRGELVAAFDIVKAVLNSYNDASPFWKLEYWKERVLCACCRSGRNVAREPLKGCTHGRLCGNCRTSCAACGDGICKQCNPACSTCGTTRCSKCVPSVDYLICPTEGCGKRTCVTCVRSCKVCRTEYCAGCMRRDSRRGPLETVCLSCRKDPDAMTKRQAMMAGAVAAVAPAPGTVTVDSAGTATITAGSVAGLSEELDDELLDDDDLGDDESDDDDDDDDDDEDHDEDDD